MDGQYNAPFIDGMNKFVFENDDDCKESFWWPVQWNPAHWLDKVFSKFKDSSFVDEHSKIFLHKTLSICKTFLFRNIILHLIFQTYI